MLSQSLFLPPNMLRCLDCENTQEGDFDREEDAEDDLMVGGLDSLASAAQLASGCHEDPNALLTPRMLALVAPYKVWTSHQAQTGSGIASTSVAATFRKPPSLIIENGAKPPLSLPPLQNAGVKRALAPDEASVGDGSSSPSISTEHGWSHAPPTKRLSLQGLPPTLLSEKENNVRKCYLCLPLLSVSHTLMTPSMDKDYCLLIPILYYLEGGFATSDLGWKIMEVQQSCSSKRQSSRHRNRASRPSN